MAIDTALGGEHRRLGRGEVATNVWSIGPADAPVIVFVHGFPDTHTVWRPVIARLADRFRCVAYDVRGAGDSTAPASTSGYRLTHLVDDLLAVADLVSPGRPVHLVAHDWGSVQAWEAVLLAGGDPGPGGAFASYTTISGPAAGHFARWIRSARAGSWHRRRAVLRQLGRSWYILAFQLPWLPERVLGSLLATPARARRFLGSGHAAPSVVSDAVHGLGLYRANLRGGGLRHGPRTRLPVQLVVPTRDAFLTPAVYDDLPRWCSNLTRHDLDAGHWVQLSHPDEVAALVADFVTRHDPAPPRSGAGEQPAG